MKLVENVYGAVLGAYADEADYVIQNVRIQNAFEKGKPCGEAYKRVYKADCRLCERLGVDEDPDVEMIIDGMFDITRIVSQMMFQYGVVFEKEMMTQH